MKSNKSFRIDDLLCKKVGSVQSSIKTASNDETSSSAAAVIEHRSSYSPPSSRTSPVSSHSPDENLILDLHRNNNNNNNRNDQSSLSSHKQGKILQASSSSSSSYYYKGRNSPLLPHHQQQPSVIMFPGGNYHTNNRLQINNNKNYHYENNNNNQNCQYYSVEKKPTLTFYSPTPSPSPKSHHDGSSCGEKNSIDHTNHSNNNNNSNYIPSTMSNGNGLDRSSTRSSSSDGRSSSNSLIHEPIQYDRTMREQARKQLAHGNHHHHNILSQQLAGSFGPGGGPAQLFGTMPSSASSTAGFIPSLWPASFLSLPLIDPSTGQPTSTAALAARASMNSHSQISPGQHHGQSIAERAALLFSFNNRFHPYGIPFGGSNRPTHSLLTVGSKRKGGQIRFSNSQTGQLEKSFVAKHYLNATDRKKLAQSLGLTDRQVKTWFQNRRAKWRKSQECKNYEAESHISGSSFNGHQDDSPDDGRCDSVNSLD